MMGMCGLAGILIGKTKMPRRDMDAIHDLFTRLLLQSEHRGPMATGAAWLDALGRHGIHKAPEPASRFVTNTTYGKWRSGIPPSATLLMGHTRWPTQGSHLDNRNNHPLADRRVKPIILTHNGNIPMVAQYFKRFRLTRRWKVDSELLARLARRHAGLGEINVPALLSDMAQCEGRIAAVLTWTVYPEAVIFIRLGKPLFLARNARRRLLIYASEPAILTEATAGDSGWLAESMREDSALMISANNLNRRLSFEFG